jgi:predicted RNA-binding Zn ribbon-like protein
MNFSWSPHRFSGGALALDVANSVILRFDDRKRIDRFAIAENLAAFPEAAGRFCSEQGLAGGLMPVPASRAAGFLSLREAIDAHFRHRVASQTDDPVLLAALLEAIASVLRCAAPDDQANALDRATATSALRLAASAEPERLKICPNCAWLFLDRSRNRSRTWCDMSVCGNRAKARLHYRKNKELSS